MSGAKTHSRFLVRISANLTAVAAVSAIFGLKVEIDGAQRRAEAERLAARQAAIAAYDPYFTEQP